MDPRGQIVSGTSETPAKWLQWRGHRKYKQRIGLFKSVLLLCVAAVVTVSPAAARVGATQQRPEQTVFDQLREELDNGLQIESLVSILLLDESTLRKTYPEAARRYDFTISRGRRAQLGLEFLLTVPDRYFDESLMATTMARAFGPDADVQRHVRLQLFHSLLKPNLEDALGEDFGGTWIDHETFTINIGVRDDVGQAHPRALESVSLTVPLVELADAGIRLEGHSRASSWAELSNLADTVAASIPGQSIQVTPRVKTGGIRVIAMGASTAELGSLRSSAVSSTVEFLRRSVTANDEAAQRLAVDMVEVVAHSGSEATVTLRGGVPLSGCTSGFTAQNGSWRGIVIADHCHLAGTGNGWWSGGGESLYSLNDYYSGGNGEFEFLGVDSSVTVPNEISYASEISIIQSIRYWDQVAVGEIYCREGKTTGFNCGTVDETHFLSFFPVPGCTGTCPRFIASIPRPGSVITQPGDSGGPWFVGSVAVGIQSGRYVGLNYDVWGVAGFAQFELDASILTSSK